MSESNTSFSNFTVILKAADVDEIMNMITVTAQPLPGHNMSLKNLYLEECVPPEIGIILFNY